MRSKYMINIIIVISKFCNLDNIIYFNEEIYLNKLLFGIK
jgi:hypothetical protein